MVKKKRSIRKLYLFYCLSRFYLVIIFISIPSQVFAFLDFIKVIGNNSGSTGRGGTALAIGEPGNMNFNPAIISEIKGNAVEIDFLMATANFEFKYTGTNNEREASNMKDRIGILPGMNYVSNNQDSPWSWGLSFTIPDGFFTDYTIQSKNFGPVNAFSEILHFRLAQTTAYKITPNLTLGLRIGVDYGTLDLRMPLGLAYLDLGTCDSVGASGALGLLYKPSEKIAFGLYYETTKMGDLKSRDNDGYLKFSDGTNCGKIDIEVDEFQFPDHFGFGVAYRPFKSWRFSADIKYICWSDDWNELKLNLKGDSVNLSRLTIPLDIDDQIPLSFGIEYFPNEIWTFLIGYHYNDDPMKANYLNPIIAAEEKHLITCGFSVQPVKQFKFGVSFMYGMMDDPEASDIHAYDLSIERQLGLQRGDLQSELSGSSANYTCFSIELSFVVFW